MGMDHLLRHSSRAFPQSLGHGMAEKVLVQHGHESSGYGIVDRVPAGDDLSGALRLWGSRAAARPPFLIHPSCGSISWRFTGMVICHVTPSKVRSPVTSRVLASLALTFVLVKVGREFLSIKPADTR